MKKSDMIKKTLYLEFENDSILKVLAKFNVFNRVRKENIFVSKINHFKDLNNSKVESLVPEIMKLS